MPDDQPARDDLTLDLAIEGMTCAGCARRVERGLKALPGVLDASVNLASEHAAVRFAPGSDPRAAAEAAGQAVVAAGYKVLQEPRRLAIEGMTCASCVGRVERALLGVPGVLSASVNLGSESAEVQRLTGQAPDRALLQAVEAAGYNARLPDSARPQAERERRDARARRELWAALLAGLLALPLVAAMVPALWDSTSR